MRRTPLFLALVTMVSGAAFGQSSSSAPAVPLEPIGAIADALRTYRVIGLGEGAHRGEQDAAFRRALIADRRVVDRANDLVTECGNSRYQSVIDRYTRGDEVPHATLCRVWEDSIVATPICDSAVYQNFYREVREVNEGLPRERQWRVLLGGPPIDWDAVKTFDDITKFESGRDAFVADLIRREVLGRNAHFDFAAASVLEV